MIVLNESLLSVEKRNLVFKLSDRKSGEAGSISEGRMGTYRDGVGDSLSRSKTLQSVCARIDISTNSSGRGTTESGGAIVTQQPNLSSQRHALTMNERDVILKIFMRSAAILTLSQKKLGRVQRKAQKMIGGLRNVTNGERL